jgi:hypothetical protein
MLMYFLYGIIYIMAVSCKVGRPYHIADIDFRHDPDQELYDRFYGACAQLHYFDTVLLSRALGVSLVTIRLWKAKQTFPARRGTAQQVITWVNNGKPERVIKQSGIATGMV